MKTNEEYEKEFMEAAKDKTGHSVEDWMNIMQPKGFAKMKEAQDWLKNEQGVSHMNATFIAGIYMNGGKPVYDSKALFEAHFEGNEDKRGLYHKIEKLVTSSLVEVQVVPTKGYISFRNGKEFAVAKINKKQIRVGLDLGDAPFNDYTEKAKSLGTMPRISHMVEVHSESDVNDDLKKVIIRANKVVNS